MERRYCEIGLVWARTLAQHVAGHPPRPWNPATLESDCQAALANRLRWDGPGTPHPTWVSAIGSAQATKHECKKFVTARWIVVGPRDGGFNFDRRFWFPRGQRARINFSGSITPDVEARAPGRFPTVVYRIKVVMPIPGPRCIGRVEIRSSCNSCRKPIDLALRESLVATGELPIVDLSTGVWMPSSATRIDDFIALVIVVLATSRKDPGFH
jgi:hypothetical protein